MNERTISPEAMMVCLEVLHATIWRMADTACDALYNIKDAIDKTNFTLENMSTVILTDIVSDLPILAREHREFCN